MNWKRLSVFVAVMTLAGLLSAPADAVVVNVDFEGSRSDPTHVGDDGVLSSPGGTVWNSVVFDTSRFDLFDEFGNATPVDVDVIPAFGTYGAWFTGNTLQDSGTDGTGFDILDLVPTETYDLAVYIDSNTGFALTDLNGTYPDYAGNTPTGLPGVLNQDYLMFTNLVPYYIGGGSFGLSIRGIDGLITGFQLDGAIIPEPSMLALSGLIVFVLLRFRRR